MNLERKETIVGLEKKARKEKKAFWKDLAERLNKHSRQLPSINLEKIEKLALKNPGKILVVPGKVLGKGAINSKVRVAAFDFSAKALQEIKKQGEALKLSELIEGKEKPSNMVIVK